MEDDVSVEDCEHMTSKVTIADATALEFDLFVFSEHCANGRDALCLTAWVSPTYSCMVSMFCARQVRHAAVRAKGASLVDRIIARRFFVRLYINVRATFASFLQVRCRHVDGFA